MKNLWWRVGFIATLVVLASLLLAACGGSSSNNGSETTSDHANMTGMGSDADPDLAFIDAMIVHHESAVAMAEVALDEADHEEIQQLANAIIETQTSEIEQLREWRDEWFPDASATDLTQMHDMPGMNMTDADMQMLRDAEEFDRAFIDMMIPHHESAITMAKDLQETTTRSELRTLTEEIISAQQAEIDQMREWREAWFASSQVGNAVLFPSSIERVSI